MKSNNPKRIAFFLAFFLTIASVATAQKASKDSSVIEERNVRAEMEFLASDALQGRGSGTEFERLAAQYIGSQMRQFGVEPAGDAANNSSDRTYVQTVSITRNAFAAAPKLSYSANGLNVVLEHGKEMLVARLNAASVSGKLQKINPSDQTQSGAIVFVRFSDSDSPQTVNEKLQKLAASGAVAVLAEELPMWRQQWQNLAARRISFTAINGKTSAAPNLIVVSKPAAAALSQIPDGTNIEIKGELAAAQNLQTWNAIGKLTGSDAASSAEIILLSAHLDHLGVRENAPGEDKIFNGADDDASGCVAVLELARTLASAEKRPKRTVYFVFFGSEEAGGYGAQYFVNNLPFSKDKLIANLEFEMIGRPDAKVAADELWLTGYERSNLGAELAKQGAKLVADPHPEQNFFQRSDNYTLARQGIIAHTVSSFGLHADYHRASDEVKTIDFNHMTRAINSMVKPINWLVNSNFKPAWYEGKKP